MKTGSTLASLSFALGTGVIYFFSNPNRYSDFDYTFRIAGALLDGRLGLDETPPSWLSEMVPFEGAYYSVFPLGSVLSLLPVAALREAGLVERFPSAVIVALTAAAISIFVHLLAQRHEIAHGKKWLLASLTMFGTWMWCNLTFGGAWQIALGLAVLGQVGALYYILIERRPLRAGLFFALAFGNRTEIILLTPLFLYLACRAETGAARPVVIHWPTVLRFSVSPFILGVATLAYNYVRFHSAFDFGYARIPGVLHEPWYERGIFSPHAIAGNMKAMLFESWKTIDRYPYLTPTGFGGSIFLATPFLIMLFRPGARDSHIKMTAWIAIALLTALLWLHGNPGGWQFSYRYAMILLPWMFLILLETSRSRASAIDIALFGASVAINAYATYLFHWTSHVQP